MNNFFVMFVALCALFLSACEKEQFSHSTTTTEKKVVANEVKPVSNQLTPGQPLPSDAPLSADRKASTALTMAHAVEQKQSQLDARLKEAEDKLLKTSAGTGSTTGTCTCCTAPPPKVIYKTKVVEKIVYRDRATPAASQAAAPAQPPPPPVMAGGRTRHGEICNFSLNGQVLESTKVGSDAECDSWQERVLHKRFPSLTAVSASPTPAHGNHNRSMSREICQIRVKGEIIAETLMNTKADCERWRDKEAKERGLTPRRN